MDPVPLKVRLSAPGGVAVSWSDGHESIYPNGYLRRKCPCATCEDRQPQPFELEAGSLPVLGQEVIRALSASVVGRYALQFRWNDGHDAGLYTFEYLRSLCPCQSCSGAAS